MLNLVTEFGTPPPQIKFVFREDDDGDLSIVVSNEVGDSVVLGFVACISGKLYRYRLGGESRRIVEQMGLQLTNEGEWQTG